MSSLATMTIGQWIGLIGLILFSIMLIWSLVQWHNAPPDKS